MSDSDLPIIAGVIPEQLGVHVTPLGLEFSPNITQENYAKLMGCLLDIADFSVHYNPMFIGDALNYGEMRWRETYLQWAETTKIRVDLLRNYKWVCSRCPIGIRQPGLTYNHYKALAPLPTLEERAQWAEAASRANWNTDELRRLIKVRRFSLPQDAPILPPSEQEANEILLSPERHLISPSQLRQWCEQLARHVLHGQITQAAALASTILQRFKEEAQYRRTIEAKAAPKYTPRR